MGMRGGGRGVKMGSDGKCGGSRRGGCGGVVGGERTEDRKRG